MENVVKPNDIFAAVLQVPDITPYDLVKSNMMPDNTQLMDKDFYKSSDVVQNAFKDSNGVFNQTAFDNAYLKAAQTYAELGSDQQLAQFLEWDPLDVTAPVKGKHYDITPIVSKDLNPYKNLYSRTALNSIDANDMSLRELAQNSKVYDTETKTWSETSANNLSFFDKFFKDTLVYATYDQDAQEIDALTGQLRDHKKGDWKVNNDGDFFIEKLGKREIYGKQIVNPMDMLTTDGSAFNKMDFFDSDGKEKSMTGTTIKFMVEVAPYLIPGVQVAYGGYSMAMGLAYVLPTFYKSIEGLFLDDTTAGNESDLWKSMTASQGYLAKFNTRSLSDEGSESFFNYEQLGGLISDIYSQIYEQRSAASLSKLFYKNQEVEYLAKLEKEAGKQLQMLNFTDEISGIKRTDAAYTKIARAAGSKIQELNEIDKKRSKLAVGLNLAYMAMTQSADVYNDALTGGYDRKTAGAATLLSAAGQFWLMSNNPMGHWFLDKTTGYKEESSEMRRALNVFIKKEFPKIEEGVQKLSSSNKDGKQLIGSAFVNVKNKIKNYIGAANTDVTSEGAIDIFQSMKRNAIIEGVEEVSEQAVIDSVKGVIDFLSFVGIVKDKDSQGKDATFGGLSNVFSEKGWQVYMSNLVGGVVGGGLFEFENSVMSPLLKGQSISRELRYNFIDYVSNGKAKELLDLAKETSQRFGSNTLAPVTTNVNGEQLYLGAKDMTQADFIYSYIEKYVNNLDNMLNSEDIKHTNESWVRKAIIDEVKVQDMLVNNTDGFILSDIKELIDQIVTLKSIVANSEKNGEDTSVQASELKELKNQLDEISSGEKADYYYGLSLFTLNKNLHKDYVALNINDYVDNTYKKDFESLTKAEQDTYSAEFSAIMKDDTQFKARMKAMFAEFSKQNDIFSPALQDYAKDSYSALRNVVFKTLMNNKDGLTEAVLNGDIETLKKVWKNIHQLNIEFAKKGLINLDLNSSINISFGKFLLDNGLLSIELSEKDKMKKLGIKDNLNEHLQSQAILQRLEKEGTLKDLTMSDLFWLQNNNPIIEEVNILNNTILQEYNAAILEVQSYIDNEQPIPDELTKKIEELGNKKVEELYKPEVFENINIKKISDVEKEDLITRIDGLLPIVDTIEGTNIEFLLHNFNTNNRNEVQNLTQQIAEADPLDLENINNLNSKLTSATNSKTLNIITKTQVLNKKAFVNNHVNDFLHPVLNSLVEIGLTIDSLSIEEFIQAAKVKGLTNSQILHEILSSPNLELNEAHEDTWEFLKASILKAAYDAEITGEHYSFAELIPFIIKVMEKLENDTEKDNLGLDDFLEIVTETTMNIVEIIGNDKNKISDKFIVNFNPATNDYVKNSGELVNNVVGNYTVSQDPYIKNTFYSPIAQILIDFAMPIMKNKEKMDNEVLETAKTELSKLAAIKNSDVQSHVDYLTKSLNKIIAYGNVQNNTLLDKLREVQISLYRDGKNSKSAFELLKDFNQLFSLSNSPTEFKLDTSTRTLLDKALYTVSAVRGIIKAMTYTDTAMNMGEIISYDTLYGYNVNFNKMYEKNKINTVLGILSSEDAQLLHKEVSIIEGKLKHFKLLADNNSLGTIQEHSKIKTALVDALHKRITEPKDTLSLMSLSYGGKPLISFDDLEKASDKSKEEQTIYLEHIARNNFLTIIKSGKNIEEVLDELFKPFKDANLKHADFSFLENRDTTLTESLATLEVKDWYMYVHSVLAGSSVDFLKLYNNYLKKEVSLTENFRAPFFTQQFVMRQAYGYINGSIGKKIMAHSVSFMTPDLEQDISPDTSADEFSKQFLAKILNAETNIPISWLYFIKGTSGTGKSDILANFVLWAIIESDQKPLGKLIDIVALAPTEKTIKVLEKSLERNMSNIPITKSVVEDYLDNILGENYVERIKTLQESTITEGEVLFKNNGSGIYIADKTAIFSEETLDLLFKDNKAKLSSTNTILIIDEASKLNSLQYQLLNYIAKNNDNYHIIVLGDDLQEGASIGKVASSSLENIHMPSSIKLKSTIRGENIHRSDNNILLEIWTDSVRNHQFFSGQIKTVSLSHSILPDIDGNLRLNGDRFIDTLSVEELQTLDATKEILFITDTGKLTSSQEDIIKKAFGDAYLTKIKVSAPDVQGQEFDQVVLLNSLPIEGTLDLAKARSIYTLLTRAKIAGLIVGKDTPKKLQFELIQKNITSDKSLDSKEVKVFLDERFEETNKLLESLAELLKEVPETKAPEAPEAPEVPIVAEILEEFGIEEDDAEIVKEIVTEITDDEKERIEKEKEELLILEDHRQKKAGLPEVGVEVSKDVFDRLETENEIALTAKNKNTSQDVKVISYTGHYNLGKKLPELNETAIHQFLESVKSNNELTDFAAFVKSIYGELSILSGQELIDTFNTTLNKFLIARNDIVGKIISSTSISSSNGVFSVTDLNGNLFNTNLIKNAYIRLAKEGEYSLDDMQTINYTKITGDQLFITIDINGIPITLASLSLQSTATNPTLNTKGDITKLLSIYANLLKTKKTPINLMGNIILLSGVQSKTNVTTLTQVKLNASRQNLAEILKGTTIEEYKAFRGPSIINGVLDKQSELEFMEVLEKELNKYNKTPITIVSNKDFSKRKIVKTKEEAKKRTEAYQKYMFRPYVIVSYYANNQKFKKLVLLYPEHRSLDNFWTELSNTKLHKETLISKYQSWKVIGEFLNHNKPKTLTKKFEQTVQDRLEWVTDTLISAIFGLSGTDNMASNKSQKNIKIISIFKKAVQSWDSSKSSFEDFMLNNTIVQGVFKARLGESYGGLENYTLNPLFFMQSYLKISPIITPEIQEFNKFIHDANIPIYYNTRIGSSNVTEKIGQYIGEFEEGLEKNYFIGYHTEGPNILINLEGINAQPEVVVAPKAAPSTSSSKLNVSTAYLTVAIGPFKLNKQGEGEEVASIDLNNYPNILRITDSSPKQKIMLNNFITNKIFNFIQDNYEDREQKLGNESADIDVEVNALLSILNTKAGQNSKVLTLPNGLAEIGMCKVR